MRSASRRWISAAKRSAVNSLARLRWFAPVGRAVAEHLGRKSLAQVTCCFSDERIRRAVQRSVLDLIGPETKIVSGHRWCRDRRHFGERPMEAWRGNVCTPSPENSHPDGARRERVEMVAKRSRRLAQRGSM